LIAFNSATENLISAFTTGIAGLFITNPFFRAEFSPVWNRSQNYLFADRHGKVIDMPAGKLLTLMTSGVPLLRRTLSYIALVAMHKTIFRQASVASNVSGTKRFTARKRAFAGYFALVKIH
jgi:hypothetical protein